MRNSFVIKRKSRPEKPTLTEDRILNWADAHLARTGTWPSQLSGNVFGVPGETWNRINSALRHGYRGLRPNSSLPKLLAERRGKRYFGFHRTAPLTEEQILAWADAHFAKTGKWPNLNAGLVLDTDENWFAINLAMRRGYRGLRPDLSLAQLLAKHRGRPYHHVRRPSPLNEEQILAWADQHYVRTGAWPSLKSGSVADSPHEDWSNIDSSLKHNRRGLTAKLSLARFLAAHRGKRYSVHDSNYSEEQLLRWADAHHARFGRWPTQNSGHVFEEPSESWIAIDMAFRNGSRGLAAGSSLVQFLAKHRGKRNHYALAPLTPERILAWADCFHERTGHWPTRSSGPVEDSGGETWTGIDLALKRGTRGLSFKSSLARFLAEHRGN